MATTTFIPIKVQQDGDKRVIICDDIDEKTLRELQISEATLEEFVRTNVSALFPEETLLIVGQQVRNTAAGRADLVAIDESGNIVLMELKCDQNTITTRREPFEFQAIRYAANYAGIKTQQDIVQQLFAPYIERHKEEIGFKQELDKGLTPSELAIRLLAQFLQENQAQNTLNRSQRIVLVAASFDPQTLSACAWMASNSIDIRCITISPMYYEQQWFFKIEQLIPPPSLESYYVHIAPTTIRGNPVVDSPNQTRQALPRMPKLFEWNLLHAGDELFIQLYPEPYVSI